MPAAPDGPIPTGPMTATQATSVVLRAAAIPTVIVGLVAIGLAWALRGSSGAVAAGLALLIVVAFFATGQYVLGRILSSNPESPCPAPCCST